MPELTSMELTKTESKRETEPIDEDKGPKFPFGLSLSLDDEALKKLGVTTLPKVGEETLVFAKAKITSVDESQHQDRKKRRSVRLQITHLGLGKETKQKTAAEFGKKLYGD